MSAFDDWFSRVDPNPFNLEKAFNAGMERAIKIAEDLYHHSEGDNRFIYDEDVGGEIRGDMGGQYKDSERD